MRLNYDCIRDVLFQLEELLSYEYSNGTLSKNVVSFQQLIEKLSDKYPPEDVYYSLSNLEQAGYIKAKTTWASSKLISCFISDITYSGNEFINKIRPDTIWEKIKRILKKIGSISLPIISNTASSLVASEISSIIS